MLLSNIEPLSHHAHIQKHGRSDNIEQLPFHRLTHGSIVAATTADHVPPRPNTIHRLRYHRVPSTCRGLVLKHRIASTSVPTADPYRSTHSGNNVNAIILY